MDNVYIVHGEDMIGSAGVLGAYNTLAEAEEAIANSDSDWIVAYRITEWFLSHTKSNKKVYSAIYALIDHQSDYIEEISTMCSFEPFEEKYEVGGIFDHVTIPVTKAYIPNKDMIYGEEVKKMIRDFAEIKREENGTYNV